MGMRGSPDNLSRGTHPWYEKGYAAWTHADHSQVICRGALELLAVYVTCKDNACLVDAYDGDSTASPLLSCFDAQGARTMPFVPLEPIYLKRGLYLVLSGDVKCVFVQYRPIPSGWRP